METTKKCSRCKELYPFSHFSKNKIRKDGYSYWCKDCVAKYHKQHYEKNKDQINKRNKQYRESHNEYNHVYYQEHKEESIDRVKQYYQEHKEERREYNKQYYQEHKEERNKYSKQWRKTNPEKANMHGKKWRAKKAGLEGSHTVADEEHIKKMQGYKCISPYHDGNNGPLTVDHIVPITKGGRDDVTNLQAICRSCNAKKRTKTEDYRSKKLKQKIFRQFDLFEDAYG